MSSSSSASQASTNQTDNRRVIGQGAISAESGASVNYQVLDANAINQAFDFGKASLSTVGDTVKQSFGFATKANAQALDSLMVTTDVLKDAYADAKGRGALTDKILIGTVAMAGLIAFAAIRKG
jgi:hypothetical protein